MGRVQLKPVQASCSKVLRRTYPPLHYLLDLRVGQLMGRERVAWCLERRWCHRGMVGLGTEELTTDVGELPHQQSTMPVYEIRLLPHDGDDLVKVGLHTGAAARGRRRMHEGGPGDDHADATRGQALEVLLVSLGGKALLDHSGPGREGYQPIAQRLVAQREGAEHVWECRRHDPSSSITVTRRGSARSSVIAIPGSPRAADANQRVQRRA